MSSRSAPRSRGCSATAAAPRHERRFAPFSRCSRGCSATAAAPGDELRSLRGGGDRNRTDDLLLAKQALSQLSYTPSFLRRHSRRKITRRRPRLRLQPRKPQPAHRSPLLLCAALAVQAHRCRGLRFRLRRNAALPRPDILLSQKSVVGQGGFEPPTSRLSSARSNQLSY